MIRTVEEAVEMERVFTEDPEAELRYRALLPDPPLRVFHVRVPGWFWSHTERFEGHLAQVTDNGELDIVRITGGSPWTVQVYAAGAWTTCGSVVPNRWEVFLLKDRAAQRKRVAERDENAEAQRRLGESLQRQFEALDPKDLPQA